MENENLKPIEKLTPFTKMIMTIGTLPSSFYASMSYYESMVWLYEYLKNQVIPTVNNNAEAVEELQTTFTTLETFISEYFENLDVQEEINNKLDEMAEDGTLTNLIKDYVDPIIEDYKSEIDEKIDAQDEKIDEQDEKIDDQDEEIASFKESVNSSINTQNANINVLNGRMDSFSALTEGSTTGDAELADIRVDFMGSSYSTAGDSTRGQSDFLNSKIEYLTNGLNVYMVEAALDNGTLPNPYNADMVRMTNYIPVQNYGYIDIDVSNFTLGENEVLTFGYQVYNSEKVAYSTVANAVTNTATTYRLPNSQTPSNVSYVRVDIGVYNTSTETRRSVRKTDFTNPGYVRVKSYKDNEIELINNKINTINTTLPNKLDKSVLSNQVYIGNLYNNTTSKINIYCEESGSTAYIKLLNNALIVKRVGSYSNEFNYNSILEIIDNTYQGTSPSGVTDCIIIPGGYTLILDTATTPRLQIISRDNVNTNTQLQLLYYNDKVYNGELSYYFNMYKNNNLTNKYEIPTYWNNELADTIEKYQTNITECSKLINFIFITDQHYTTNAHHSSELIKYLSKALNTTLVLSGGDVVTTDTTSKVSAVNEMQNYISTLTGEDLRIIQTYGNHDFNNVVTDSAYALTNYQIYNSMIVQREAFSNNSTNIDVMKYDDTDNKVRYINFNSSGKRGQEVNEDMIDLVLDYIEELDNTWNVILLCHAYYLNSGDISSVHAITAYYVDKIATLEHTCQANIVGLFTGHVHTDFNSTYTADNGGKLTIISTTTDSINQVPAGSGRTKGTTTEQAFDIVQVDPIAKKIYMTRVGYGNDRELSY